MVSNHRTRRLKGTAPGVSLLPAICDAAAGRSEILLDSGIRGGTDVLKALALGASGVLVARPVLWGLATDGQRGVQRVPSPPRDELRGAMKLSGCRDVSQARRLDLLAHGSRCPPQALAGGHRRQGLRLSATGSRTALPRSTPTRSAAGSHIRSSRPGCRAPVARKRPTPCANGSRPTARPAMRSGPAAGRPKWWKRPTSGCARHFRNEPQPVTPLTSHPSHSAPPHRAADRHLVNGVTPR